MLLSVVIFSLYIQAQPFRPDVPCQEGINLLPMYGGVEKCAQQLKIDAEFLANCDKGYPSREVACEEHINMGWKYMEQKDYDTAMKRLNQAWLLNKKNPVVYSSFGWLLILTERYEYDEAAAFFDKSVEIAGVDDNVLMSIVFGFIELYKKTEDKKYCRRSVEVSRLALDINPDNKTAQLYLEETNCN